MKTTRIFAWILVLCLCLSGCFGNHGITIPSTDTTPATSESTTTGTSTESTGVTTVPTTTEASTTETSTVETTVPETTVPETTVPETTVTESNTLPLVQDTESFYFSSGAGGWGTELTLNKDGSFAGVFHDSDMGSTGEGHPHGTIYICSFSGKFEDITQLDDHSYKMTLGDTQLKYPAGEEWIEDEVLYIATGPYGLDGGTDFIFYLPDTPTDTLSQDFLSWWPYRYDQSDDPKATLSCFGILNVATGNGFFTAV